MDVALESVKGSFVLTILVGVWIALVLAAAICHKVQAMQKTVHKIHERFAQKDALSSAMASSVKVD